MGSPAEEFRDSQPAPDAAETLIEAAWVTAWVGGWPEKMVGVGKGIAASILSGSWRITGQVLQNQKPDPLIFMGRTTHTIQKDLLTE